MGATFTDRRTDGHTYKQAFYFWFVGKILGKIPKKMGSKKIVSTQKQYVSFNKEKGFRRVPTIEGI